MLGVYVVWVNIGYGLILLKSPQVEKTLMGVSPLVTGIVPKIPPEKINFIVMRYRR
jgi:hypothetical protein